MVDSEGSNYVRGRGSVTLEVCIRIPLLGRCLLGQE